MVYCEPKEADKGETRKEGKGTTRGKKPQIWECLGVPSEAFCLVTGVKQGNNPTASVFLSALPNAIGNFPISNGKK